MQNKGIKPIDIANKYDIAVYQVISELKKIGLNYLRNETIKEDDVKIILNVLNEKYSKKETYFRLKNSTNNKKKLATYILILAFSIILIVINLLIKFLNDYGMILVQFLFLLYFLPTLLKIKK